MPITKLDLSIAFFKLSLTKVNNNTVSYFFIHFYLQVLKRFRRVLTAVKKSIKVANRQIYHYGKIQVTGSKSNKIQYNKPYPSQTVTDKYCNTMNMWNDSPGSLIWKSWMNIRIVQWTCLQVFIEYVNPTMPAPSRFQSKLFVGQSKLFEGCLLRGF